MTDGIEVTWTDVKEAREYRIYRKAFGESNFVCIAVVKDKTIYVDAAVENGASYCYYVAPQVADVKAMTNVEANNKARADLKSKEEEAYSKYKEELDKFAAKHHGYHLTYRIDGDNVEFEIEENHSKNLEVYNNEFRRGIKSLFDMFDSLWF